MDTIPVQVGTLDAYLEGRQPIPSFLDAALVERIAAQAASAPQDALRNARSELTNALGLVAGTAKPETISISSGSDTLTGFSAALQPKLIATSTISGGDPDEIRGSMTLLIQQLLDAIGALELQLALNPVKPLDTKEAIRRYNRRCAVHQFLLFWTDYLVNARIVKLSTKNDPEPERWSPIGSIQRPSPGELIRMLIRATVVDEQIDDDLNSLLFQLARGVHLDLGQTIDPVRLLWRQENENTLLDWVTNQETRDRVGGSVAPYIAHLLTMQAEPYDPEFHAAFDAMLQAVQLYYQSQPVQATATPLPATPASVEPGQPVRIPVTVAPEPAAAPAPAPASAPTTPIPEPVTGTGATVDFRHPDQPAQPSADQQDGQSTIKPLGIQ